MQHINGQWTQGQGGAFISTNPATGTHLWQGSAASGSQVEKAVAAARTAFPGWRDTPYDERVTLLESFRARMEEKKDELTALIGQENGKVKWDAAGEAAAVIGKLNASVKAYEERTPRKEFELQGFSSVIRHKPHGVMAVFGPYNFPAHIPNGHIIPALLAGNTIVFKPSEQTPLVGEWYVKQFEAVGLPAGVLNLVQGEKETGIALASADINGVLFTGSSAVGKILHKQFGGRPEVVLALELGGNNPLIVESYEDIKAVAYEIIQSAYVGAGQRCTCARRLIIVENDSTPALIETLTTMIGSLKIGAWDADPQPFMGPLINRTEVQRVLDAQRMLQQKGAAILVEAARTHESQPFVSPALIDVTGVLDIPDEEVFGPLLKLHRVANLDAAITEANNTQFGLSSAVFTTSRETFKYCVARLNAGLCNWNKQTTGASGMAPFGGVGCSGNHKPAGYYAADYCAYPVASMEAETLALPEKLVAGIEA